MLEQPTACRLGAEAASCFDLSQYQDILNTGADILALGTTLDSEYLSLNGQLLAGFWQHPVLAESLSHEKYISTTLDAIESMIYSGNFSLSSRTQGGSYSSEILATKNSRQMLEGSLSGELVRVAESDLDSPIAQRIAHLLFVATARFRQGDILNDRVERFVKLHTSDAFEYVQNKVTERSANESSEERLSEYDNDAQQFWLSDSYAFAGADLLAGSHPNSWDDDQLRESRGKFARLAEDSAVARNVLDVLANFWWCLDKFCASLDLPAEEFNKAWQNGYGNKNKPGVWNTEEYRVENVRRMLKFESQHPGFCHTLFRQFGIRNIARFPETMLQALYDGRDAQFEHEVFLLSAVSDSNGSATRGSMPKFETLRQSLQEQGVGMRVVEVGSKRELKLRARLAALAGLPLASAVMLDAHGYNNHVLLDGEVLTKQDIQDWAGSLPQSGSHQFYWCD